MRTGLFFAIFLAVALGLACSSSSTTNTQANATAAEPDRAVSSLNSKQKAPGLPANGRPILHFEPAAEDSQIATATNAEGRLYELRIFKRHPQLVKVESTEIGPKERSLQIVTRDGQVKNVTTDKIENLKQATASQLLQLAGIRAGAPAMPGKSGAKEAQ